MKLTLDALQQIRIKQQREEMDKENNSLAAIKTAKEELDLALKQCVDQPREQARLIAEYETKVTEYQLVEYKNGDSLKQLLARSRYIFATKINAGVGEPAI